MISNNTERSSDMLTYYLGILLSSLILSAQRVLEDLGKLPQMLLIRLPLHDAECREPTAQGSLNREARPREVMIVMFAEGKNWMWH